MPRDWNLHYSGRANPPDRTFTLKKNTSSSGRTMDSSLSCPPGLKRADRNPPSVMEIDYR